MLKKLSFQIITVLLAIMMLASNVAASSEGGIVPTALPMPANTMYPNPIEINDNGLILGTVYESNYSRPVLWDQEQIIEIGKLDGTTYMNPVHLNNNGQVIGTSDNSVKGWIWENGVLTDLGKLSSYERYTIPQFLNDNGVVAGISYDQNYKIASWIWQDGEFTQLDSIPGTNNSQIRGLNNNGQVIGFSYDSNYTYTPWIWEDGQYTLIVGLPNGTSSYPQFLNNRGDVIGSSNVSNVTKYWLWTQGQLTELAGLQGKPNTQIQGLNENGQILGTSYDQNYNNRQSWILTDGQYTEIAQYPGLTNTNVNTLNDLGQVVGTSYDSNYSNQTHWIWTNGVMTTLEKLAGSTNTYPQNARDYMMMYADRQVMNNYQILGRSDSAPVVWSFTQAPQTLDAPIITADQTELTNKDVQITIEYSSGAAQKLYRIDGGDWEAYSGPVSVEANGTVEAKAVSGSGAESEVASYEITIIDKEAPTATVAYSTTSPTNQDVIATITPSEDVTITSNGGSSSYTFDNNGSFTFEFKDAAGNTGSAIATVSNIDKVAPTLSIELDKTSLWSPNHKLVMITAQVNATDDISDVSIVLHSITSNESDFDPTLVDDDAAYDIQNIELGTQDTTFDLRAERAGSGNGRIYTVTYNATDAAGNVTTATAEVVVPHSQGSNGADAKGKKK